MTREEEDLLVEQVASAHRPPSTGELRYHPAWHDLGPEARRRAFDLAAALRPIEAALDLEGLSSTAHAVLARIAKG